MVHCALAHPGFSPIRRFAQMNSVVPAIEVRKLVKVYKERTAHPVLALDGLSLTVRQGEIYGLLGPNGAGKTTLLRILSTLVRPTSGSAEVLGLDVTTRSHEVRRNICAVLQENAVEIFLSVEDNLATFGRFHSIPRSETGRRASRVMEQFGLSEYRKQKVIDLSGGLKRRVQVAKVFMVDKPIVFLDEATTGMDPINKRATLDAIRDQARQGRTVFLTTHLLEEAEELCDRIAIIDRGRRVALGEPHTIKSFGAKQLEIRITYDELADDALETLHRFPLSRCERRGNTLELAVAFKHASPFDVLSVLGSLGPILHFEATTGTLEDAFFELLDRRESDAPGKDEASS
jgi:ABC-2 type transport system ATP-binding protein